MMLSHWHRRSIDNIYHTYTLLIYDLSTPHRHAILSVCDFNC